MGTAEWRDARSDQVDASSARRELGQTGLRCWYDTLFSGREGERRKGDRDARGSNCVDAFDSSGAKLRTLDRGLFAHPARAAFTTI